MCLRILPFWLTVPETHPFFDEEDSDCQSSEETEADDFQDVVQGFLKAQSVRKVDVLCSLTAVLIGIALVASSIALIIITSNVYTTGAMSVTIYVCLGIIGFAGCIMTLLASKRIYELVQKWSSQQARTRAIE